MNPLLCKHEFDFNTQLMSSPPQVKCKLCGTRAFVADAIQYDKTHYGSPISEVEKREYWKAVSLTFLGSGQTTADGDFSYSRSAAGVADKMLEIFIKKFK